MVICINTKNDLTTIIYFVVMSTKSRTTRKKRVLESLQDEGTDASRQHNKRVRSKKQNLEMMENEGLYTSASSFNDNDNTIDDYMHYSVFN